jgi:hypothetical protein
MQLLFTLLLTNTIQIGLPQIPFEVYHPEYNKTVYVVASCDNSVNSMTIYFDQNEDRIKDEVFNNVNKAFDMPGVVRVQVCRKESK